MKILIASQGRLISNGSAGTTVMCGLVEAALALGWDVTYLALLDAKANASADAPFPFDTNRGSLRTGEMTYAAKPSGRRAQFVGRYDLSVVTAFSDNPPAWVSEGYDGVVAFDSLAIALVRPIASRSTIAIIGDPAGQRLWYSAGRRRVDFKLRALLLDIFGIRHFRRTIPASWKIAMFGTGHADAWAQGLQRAVLDLRPFMPALPPLGPAPPLDGPAILMFGGTLMGTASSQAFSAIFDDILPSMRAAKGMPCELRLVGDSPLSLQQEAAKHPEVKMLGRVLSFEQELSRGHFFVLPMDYPVGVRTRICSALAAGNLCIVHPSVLLNMPELADCPAVFVTPDPADYAGIVAVNMAEDRFATLRHQARDFFDAHYVASVAGQPVLQSIEDRQ
jgi:hypothetical protein